MDDRAEVGLSRCRKHNDVLIHEPSIACHMSVLKGVQGCAPSARCERCTHHLCEGDVLEEIECLLLLDWVRRHVWPEPRGLHHRPLRLEGLRSWRGAERVAARGRRAEGVGAGAGASKRIGLLRACARTSAHTRVRTTSVCNLQCVLWRRGV